MKCCRKKRVIAAVAERFSVPANFVARALGDTLDAMSERYRGYVEPSNGTEPADDYPRHALHTPRIVLNQDPLESYIDFIEVIDPFKVVPSEPEGNIRVHPTFARYVEWYRAGHLPPYPSTDTEC